MSKKIVVTFGRFSPPHIGHKAVVDATVNHAKSIGADHRVYASHSFDNKKNPIPYNDKVGYLQKVFPHGNVTQSDDKNIFHVLKSIEKEGYDDVTVVAGEDRLGDYEASIRKYIKPKTAKDYDPNKHYAFNNFKVVNAGNRDDKAEGVTGASGTKMREYVKNNDFRSFAKSTPTNNVWLARSLFKSIKKNLHEIETLDDYGSYKPDAPKLKTVITARRKWKEKEPTHEFSTKTHHYYYDHDDERYMAVNKKTDNVDMYVTGTRKQHKNNTQTFHVDVLQASKGNTIKAHQFYKDIISNPHNGGRHTILVSGKEQSEGGQYAWRKLSQKHKDVNVHGWDGKKTVNVDPKKKDDREDIYLRHSEFQGAYINHTGKERTKAMDALDKVRNTKLVAYHKKLDTMAESFWDKRDIFKITRQALLEATYSDDFEPLLRRYVGDIAKKMNLKTIPKIEIVKGEGLKTFGMYFPGEKKIQVVVRNRHPMDIIRTVAHELMHHKQNEEGRLSNPAKEGSTGSPIENEANAAAGVMLRGIAQDSPELFSSQAITEALLDEGFHDMAKGKAILMAGGPASGKDFVIANVLHGLGYINLNSDQALEMFMDREGLDKKMPDSETEKRNVVRERAKRVTNKRQELILKNKLGVIVNGTSDNYDETVEMKTALEKQGYQVQMMFVNTSDDVSMLRNIERNTVYGGRTVPESIRSKKWKEAQKLKEKYAKLFGDHAFHEVNNDHDLRTVDPRTREKQYDHFYDVHKKVRHFTYAKPEQFETPKQMDQSIPKPANSAPMLSRAKRLGLKYFGFGRYGRKIAGKNKVTHIVKDDQLVQVQQQGQQMHEEHGAGDEGTDKLVKKYADETPGQSFKQIKTYQLRKQLRAEEAEPTPVIPEPESTVDKKKDKVTTKSIRRKFSNAYPTDMPANQIYVNNVYTVSETKE